MLKKLQAVLSLAIERFKRGFGNAVTVAQKGEKQINASTGKVKDSFDKAFGGNTRKQIEDIGNVIDEQKTILTEFERELIRLQERKAKTSATDFAAQKRLKTGIERLTASIRDQRQAVKELTADKARLQGSLQATRATAEDNSSAMEAMSRAVNAASNAVLLFSGSGEFAKGVTKALSLAMGAVSAIIAIQNLRLRENTVLTGLAASAQSAFARATAGSTVALRAFKTALVTTGIGAIVVIVGLLVEKLLSLGDAADEAREELKKAQDQAERQLNFAKEQNEELETQIELEQKRARNAGASEAKIAEIRKKGLEQQIKNYENYAGQITRIGKQIEDKAKKEGASELVAQQKRLQFEKKLTADNNKEITRLKNQLESDKLDAEFKAIQEAQVRRERDKIANREFEADKAKANQEFRGRDLKSSFDYGETKNKFTKAAQDLEAKIVNEGQKHITTIYTDEEWKRLKAKQEAERIAEEIYDRQIEGALRVQKAFETMGTQVVQSFADAIASIGSQENPIEVLTRGVLLAVSNFMQTYGESILAVGLATVAFKTSLDTLQGVPAIVAGAALITAAAVARSVANKGVTPFADGGIVSGPTLGLVGEYPGASTNPEVIAPLDKLKSIIGGNGDGSGFIAETRISGRDLSIVLNRFNKDNARG